jgi:hypothetical protein
MEAIKEHDIVVLLHDLPEHGLARGDIGAVVHRYHSGDALEVEFVAGAGETVAVLTLADAEVRLMKSDEILHVRERAA